jgi:hypothetical protein
VQLEQTATLLFHKWQQVQVVQVVQGQQETQEHQVLAEVVGTAEVVQQQVALVVQEMLQQDYQQRLTMGIRMLHITMDPVIGMARIWVVHMAVALATQERQATQAQTEHRMLALGG